MIIKVLPASCGDCILITLKRSNKKDTHILVDGGVPGTYPKILKRELTKINADQELIELLIVTHIDNDHIGGIIKFFEDDSISKQCIKNIWFNSGTSINDYLNTNHKDRSIKVTPTSLTSMSVRQGVTLENILTEHGGWDKALVVSGATYKINDITIDILSPDVEKLRKLNNKWEVEKDSTLDMSAKGNRDYIYPISELINNKFVEDTGVQMVALLLYL